MLRTNVKDFKTWDQNKTQVQNFKTTHESKWDTNMKGMIPQCRAVKWAPIRLTDKYIGLSL